MAAFEFSKEYPAILPWEVANQVPLLWWRRWLLKRKAEGVRTIFDQWKSDKALLDRDKAARDLTLWATGKDKSSGDRN